MCALEGGLLTCRWFSKASHGSAGPGCCAQEVDSPFSLDDLVKGILNVRTWRPLRSWSSVVALAVMCRLLLKRPMVWTVNSPSLNTDQNVVVMQAATAMSSGLDLLRWLRMADR